jgi:hypothetical protein
MMEQGKPLQGRLGQAITVKGQPAFKRRPAWHPAVGASACRQPPCPLSPSRTLLGASTVGWRAFHPWLRQEAVRARKKQMTKLRAAFQMLKLRKFLVSEIPPNRCILVTADNKQAALCGCHGILTRSTTQELGWVH